MFSASALVAAPQKADKAMNTTSLMDMDFLRPRKSAQLPETRSRETQVKMYALITHWTPVKEAPRNRPMQAAKL
jgi:hypothetical protein